MQRAVETLDHFPSIAQAESLALELGDTLKTGWKYVESPDCLRCGGVGWHWAEDRDGRRGPVACSDCRAGKNLQCGPAGNVTRTLEDTDASYVGPGRGTRQAKDEEGAA